MALLIVPQRASYLHWFMSDVRMSFFRSFPVLTTTLSSMRVRSARVISAQTMVGLYQRFAQVAPLMPSPPARGPVYCTRTSLIRPMVELTWSKTRLYGTSVRVMYLMDRLLVLMSLVLFGVPVSVRANTNGRPALLASACCFFGVMLSRDVHKVIGAQLVVKQMEYPGLAVDLHLR